MVDIVILVIVLISALMALLRGFVREVLTIVAWVAAAVVAIYLFPVLAPMARTVLMPPVLADVASFGIAFIVFLIPALILTSRAGTRFGRDAPGIVDRLGGFAFGVARGLFVVGIAYYFTSQVMGPDNEDDWLANAQLRPLVQAMANLFPQDIGALATSSQNRSETEGRQERPESKSSTNDDESDKGYGQTDRLGLDQLITTTNED